MFSSLRHDDHLFLINKFEFRAPKYLIKWPRFADDDNGSPVIGCQVTPFAVKFLNYTPETWPGPLGPKVRYSSVHTSIFALFLPLLP